MTTLLIRVWAWLKDPWNIPTIALSIALGGFLLVIVDLLFSADSKEQRDAKALAERAALVNAISTASAERLETVLQGLKANEIHTERVIHTETIKPVFSTVCATDEYVQLFNQSLDRAERTLSGEPDREVPGNTAPPGG